MTVYYIKMLNPLNTIIMKKVIVFLSVAVLAIFSFTSCSKNTPKGVVERYLTYQQEGRIDEVLALTTLPDEEQKNRASEYEMMVTDDIIVSSFEIGEAEVSEDGNSATVHYNVTYESGDKSSETAQVKKIDGTWKIVEN